MIQTLGEERLERICAGECYHPGDRRRRIERIEVIRIQRQQSEDEPVAEPELARPADPDASWTRAEWDRMWRPSMWLRQPPRQHSMHVWHIAAILALTGYANVIANQVLNPWWHIPFNLGILGGTVSGNIGK